MYNLFALLKTEKYTIFWWKIELVYAARHQLIVGFLPNSCVRLTLLISGKAPLTVRCYGYRHRPQVRPQGAPHGAEERGSLPAPAHQGSFR